MNIFQSTSRQILKQSICARPLLQRSIQSSVSLLAKNDSSTIDSFKLPSQTSINEWEFKYDFIPKIREPKVPPLTPEAIKQDIAQEKKAKVERELFAKESSSSVKVEANSASVVHGGESVGSEPEFLQDRGSDPVDVSNKFASSDETKPANRDKYIQSSINPDINQSDVINLGENEVDHKVTSVKKQTPIVEDIEHDNLNQQSSDGKSSSPTSGSSSNLLIVLALGAGLAGYNYFFNSKKAKET